MFRLLSLLVFRLIGWRIVDHRPPGLRKGIYVVAPHTSNWDFVIGVFARSIARLTHVRYLAKRSLFAPPFGWFFRALGGYPVDRSKSTGITEQVVHYFDTIPDFAIAITPEGTRKHVATWKTGFWRIARQAQVPLILTSFDYARKEVTFREPFLPGEDMEADIAWIMAYFKRFRGKNPLQGVR